MNIQNIPKEVEKKILDWIAADNVNKTNIARFEAVAAELKAIVAKNAAVSKEHQKALNTAKKAMAESRKVGKVLIRKLGKLRTAGEIIGRRQQHLMARYTKDYFVIQRQEEYRLKRANNTAGNDIENDVQN